MKFRLVEEKENKKTLDLDEALGLKEELNESRPRTRKEIVVLQGNYGYGWDDLVEYELTGDVDKDAEIYKEIRQDKKDYAENEPQYSHRTIHRFEKIEKVEESLQKDELSDFFDKAKRLGITTVKELKDLLNQEESKGNTEKEKIDAYADSVELGNDTLSNESLKEYYDPTEVITDYFDKYEQENYGIDEEGYTEDGLERYVHCGWCDTPTPLSEMRKELNLGYICKDCQNTLYSRGEKAVYEESLKESQELTVYDFDYDRQPWGTWVKIDTDNGTKKGLVKISKNLSFNELGDAIKQLLKKQGYNVTIKQEVLSPEEVKESKIVWEETNSEELPPKPLYLGDESDYEVIEDELEEKLTQGKSDKTLKKNIATEVKVGKSPKQAYAIAKSIQKKNESFEDEHLGEVIKDDEIVDYFDNSVHDEDIVEDDFDEEHIEELTKKAIEESKKHTKEVGTTITENKSIDTPTQEIINESVNSNEEVAIDYISPNAVDANFQAQEVDLNNI